MNEAARQDGKAQLQAVKRLMVRMNPTLFYCLGAACVLEAARSAHAPRDGACAANEESEVAAAACRPGVQPAWARWLRDYVETVWPEFDWAGASAEVVARLDAVRQPAQGTAARALQEAVAAAQAACFYRVLSCLAEDPVLRERLQRTGEIEAARACDCESRFRERRRVDRFGLLRACRCALTQVRYSREATVGLAFEILGRHWSCAAPFSTMAYGDFLARVRRLMTWHVRLDRRERLLFAPWFAKPQELRVSRFLTAVAPAQAWGAPSVQAPGMDRTVTARPDPCRLPSVLSLR